LSLSVLLALALVAFFAGVVDAIAGGGGLLTLPALLAAGLPPHVALGTNKGQSVFGSATALTRYARAGLVDKRRAAICFPAGLVGALLGGWLVLQVKPDVLKPIVLGLLLASGAFIALRRPNTDASRPPRQNAQLFEAGIALVLGCYDGFFGPGVGTFLIIAFVTVLHLGLREATADAKVVNFASNLATLAVMAWAGKVVWAVSLPMAAGQAAGAWTGAHLAVKGGERVIRAVVLLVVVSLVAKLAYDLWR
jgi:uncharacterized membrane protein YfcA